MNPDDIAIVGMAGLYPQAEDVDMFWSNVLDKKDAVTESSDSWLGDDYLLNASSDDPMMLYTRKGGFLGDLSRFDPVAGQTMPRSVGGGQPDQFIALKLAYDALNDAGYKPGKFDGSTTGVILGHSVHVHRGNSNGVQQVWFHNQIRTLFKTLFPELEESRLTEAYELLRKQVPEITPDAVPGLVPNVLSGRIANRLDLMGPNYIIDAACSSSLIAVDLAIGELRSGRADMMLAGGVNTTTSPLVYSVFCSVNALSETGKIRPFDVNSNGTVLGEGAGILVLKRLSDAVANDDRIHAVIKGVGQSSDGKSSGLMAPRLEGEVLAIERAYKNSGLDPASIGLIEAHGTGIPLGDRTEIEAMRTVFGQRRGPLPTIPIGSVKSMIGHCIPASGSAAMIKLSMALKNKIVPPTLCDEVNENIGLQDTPFYVSSEARPWMHSANTPRRAAINAFGFGGINAHMILEEAPGSNFTDPTAAFAAPTVFAEGPEQVVAFASENRADMLAQLAAFKTACAAPDADFATLAQTAWTKASAHPGPFRLAIVCSSAAELTKKADGSLSKLENDQTATLQTRNGLYFEAEPMEGKVAFLFPGEMAQYPGMMLDAALAYPVVREWFDFIGRLTETQRDVRIREVTFPPMNLVDDPTKALLNDLLHRVDYGSEIVFAADQATFSLLKSLGIKPDSMLGHSTGENAALVASGCLDLGRDAVGEMIARMNEVFADVETSGVVPSGVLLTIAALDQAELRPFIDADDDIHFTMDNCPNQSIIFGPKDKIDALEQKIVALGAVCTRLPISWGYHTEFVRPMAEQFAQLFQDANLQDSDVTLYSCATAKPFPKTKKKFLETAVDQYVSRVRFQEAIEALYADGHRIFIECGPNANLTAFVRDTLGKRKVLAESADNPRRGMPSQLRHLVARLFTAGQQLDAGDFLTPPMDADRARRAQIRAKFAKAPHLPNELPYIHLNDEDAALMRSLVIPQSAQLAPSPAPAASVAPNPGLVDHSMQQHLSLMSEFLNGQANVASQALKTPYLATAPTAAPATTSRQPIEVMNLSHNFKVPFEFSAYLLSGAPSFNAMVPYLGAYEQTEARTLLENSRNPRAWTEWSLSRLAVKRAAGEVLSRTNGARPEDSQMEVLKYEGGAPYLHAPTANGHVPAISISHVDHRGIGAAAGAGWHMGVDFELPSRLHDPASFLDTILGNQEKEVIQVPPNAETAAALWSVKEAAAKALGVGIQGRPQEFEITKYENQTGLVEVSHGQHTLEAYIKAVGDGVCAVAYFAAVQ